MSLAGRHALVTGGGTGIGLAIARTLATAGSNVTITGRRANVLDDAGDIHGLNPVMMDVTVETSIIDAVQRATRAHGPITICVANAGIAEGRSLQKTELSFWRRMMATNLEGAFLTIRECLRGMEETGWGRVIAVASVAGVRGLRGAPAYTASKHGVVGLIRGLSEDYLGSGITFNALCPGYTDTEIVLQNTESIAHRAGISPEAARELMVSANRHGRLVDPVEVAAAALWLCEPGSESVSGQAIEITGGQA